MRRRLMRQSGILWLAATALLVGLVQEDASADEQARGPIKSVADVCSVQAISLAGFGGEENWSSLTVMPDGSALLGMSSRRRSAVLVRVDPDRQSVQTVMRLDEVGHLADSERQPKIHVAPMRGGDGWYHFLSHFGLETHLPLHGSRIGYDGMRRWRWHPESGGEQLGRLLTGEGAVAQALAEERLYAATFPQGLLVELDLDEHAGLRDLGRVNGVYPPRQILIGPEGRAHVLDHRGQFWRHDRSTRQMRPQGVFLPATNDVPGNLLAQGLVTLVPGRQHEPVYAMSAWGRLYRIEFPDEGPLQVHDLGAPLARIEHPQWRSGERPAATIAGLALGPDGWLYLAVSGFNRAVDESGDSYLVRCRTDGSGAQVLAQLDGRMISYLCGSQAVDAESGRVFFVGSHLTQDSPYLFVLSTPDQDRHQDTTP